MRARDRRSLVFALLCQAFGGAGCDGWPDQQGDGSGGNVDPEREVSVICARYAPVLSDSPRENSALCFGFANNASQALACVESANGEQIDCIDAWSGGSYVVRPQGTTANVYTAFVREPIGTITELGGNRYEVLVVNGPEGVCTLSQSPVGAEFCLYAE